MNMIIIQGTVDENGFLTLDQPLNLPPGKVTVIVIPVGMTVEEAQKQLQQEGVKWDILITSVPS